MAIDPMTGQDDQQDYQPDPTYKPKPVGPTATGPAVPPAPGAAPAPPPAPGVNVGHDGTYNGMNRDQWRDAWMQDKGSLGDFTAAHGGTIGPSGDKVMTPYGEELDALIGHKAGIDQHGFTSSAGMVGANTGPGGAMTNTAGAPPAAGAAGDPNSFQGQIRAMLLQQMGQNSQPIDENDPAIKGELQSQDNALERVRQQRRAAMAERNAAEGLNSGGAGSGAMDSDIAAGFEDKGTQMSAVRSQLFTRELQSRRQTLNQQMQMALQTGDAESARALQLQISQADNQLRALQLSQQQGQWNDQFGWNVSQGLYGRDRDNALFAGGGQ